MSDIGQDAPSGVANEQAGLKCLYLVVRSLDPTGRGRKRWMNRWKPALTPSQSPSKAACSPQTNDMNTNPATPKTGQSRTSDLL